MAGHSQFKNIMHKKGKQDAIRSKLFSKLAREITVAAKMGLPDPAMNARLRAAVIAARAENMPKDNIERAIKKASSADMENYDEVRYEGYAPAESRRHRRGAHRQSQPHRGRSALLLHQGWRRAGGNRAVSFMFDRVGAIVYDRKVADDEVMLEAPIEAGADDVVSGPEEHEVITALESLRDAQKALEAKFGEPKKASLMWRPQNTISVDDEGWREDLEARRSARRKRRRTKRHRQLRDLRGADGENARLISSGAAKPRRTNLCVVTNRSDGPRARTSSASSGDASPNRGRGRGPGRPIVVPAVPPVPPNMIDVSAGDDRRRRSCAERKRFRRNRGEHLHRGADRGGNQTGFRKA